MIKNLIIKGFQSHDRNRFIFSDGINLISGLSNSGKTALIRAIDLLRTGNPKTPVWASSDNVQVQLSTSLGRFSIEKQIKNEKTIQTTLGINGEKYQSGNMLPDIGLNEINIQKQFDQFYLITESPGKIARMMQDIGKVSIADTLRSELTKSINHNEKEHAILVNQVDDLTKQLNELPDIELLERKVIIHERLETSFMNLDKKINKITGLYEKIKTGNCVVTDIQNKLNILSDILDKQGRLDELSGLYNNIKSVIGKIVKLQTVSNKLNGIQIDLDIYNDALNRQQALDEIHQEIKNINAIINKIKRVINIKARVVTIESELKQTKKDYKLQLGDICGYCGSNITVAGLKRIDL